MKIMIPLILGLALTVGGYAAEEKPAEKTAPQPRVRLAPEETVAPAEKPAKPEAEPTVVLDKIFVRDSKLPMAPLKAVEPEPDKFSLLGGGPLWTGKFGSLPIAVGLWTPIDIMADDAKFRPQKTRVEMDFLRIKW